VPKYKKVSWYNNTATGYKLIKFPDGSKGWFVNGQAHREDGPAIIRMNGDKVWFLSGKKLSKKDFDSIEMVKQFQAYSLFTPKELAELKLNAEV
jgi:cold shock CspA family protein